MVDVVANHMGRGAISSNRPTPLDQESTYHSACTIDYTNQTSIEQCRIASDLPDVNTGLGPIRTVYQDWVRWLVSEYKFDGLRVDTVKHVEKDFWPGFVSAAGVYAVGEVFDGNPDYLASYAKVMPGLLNYAAYYPMNRFYQQQGSAQDLVNMLDTIGSTFPDPSALGTFLDNHDNPRWLSQKNDATLLKNALAFVILSRGIPIVYYGTEQGYSGGNDPANREDLWRSGYDTGSDLYQAIAKLAGARKTVGGLAGNDHVHLYVASSAYAWSRAGGNLIVLTTNGGKGTSGRHCFNTQRKDGNWTNAFGAGTHTSDGSGNICLDVANGEPVVLVSNGGTTAPTATKTTTTGSACPTSVSVTFTENVVTTLGETIKIAGNTAQLGNWAPDSAPALSAAQYTPTDPVWTITLTLAATQQIQYKFIKVSNSGEVAWESDPNRAYTAPACQGSTTVASSWR